ncbi:MAG: hypothetical protein M1814_003863 [Vezdaea aestivalis]|nr:MAG: hypothetical protein M1814_003863 [Vezdaea aestivalis]
MARFTMPATGFLAACLWLLLAWNVSSLGLTDTITSGGDNGRSGYEINHNMDPNVVGSNTFGQLWATRLTKNCINPGGSVPEQIFAQPLLYTPGDTQYAYVATTTNAIYKIDAKTGAIVTMRSLGVPFLQKDLDSCTDLQPCIGVTGTGIIDPDAGAWHFTSKTYADQTGGTTGLLEGRYFAHAVDVNTLQEMPGFPIPLEGLVPTNNKRRSFVSGHQHQRPALVHTGGFVYAGFASHCVLYNFTGYVIGWSPQGKIVSVFTAQGGPESDDIRGGGIWMSGGGIMSDDKGSIWLSTGNGYASQLHGVSVPGRQPPSALEEAAVHFAQASDGSLSPVDFFMPFEKEQLDGADKDLGTSPLIKLPESTFSCPNVKRIGVVTGKSGKTYFLNLDDLGGYQMGPNHGDAAIFVYQQKNSVYSGAGVYPREGGYVYIHVVQFPTTIFKFSCNAAGNPQFTFVGETADSNAYVAGVGHGATTSFKDQDGTGLAWVSDTQGFNLRVYSIQPNALKLIKTAQVNGVTKFSRPVFGDGKVYMSTNQGLIYCLGSPVNTPLTCNSPYDFGTVVIANSSSPGAANTTSSGQITCSANITTTVTAINLNSTNFQVSNLPTLPITVQAGQKFSFNATFTPSTPGPIAADVKINTTNSVALYSTNTPVTLKGVGRSLTPVLLITPNTVTFEGVITGEDPDGVDQSVIYINQGSSPLNIIGIDYSEKSEAGPFVTNVNKLGPFTWKNTPTTVPANGQVVVTINFVPPASANYAAYVRVRTNGGTKLYTVVATSSDQPKALFEFQSIDGNSWVPYSPSAPFSFGDVLQQVTLNRVFRLSNVGGAKAGRLSVTVSKPPIVAGAVVGARNNVDLAEGASVVPGQPQNATMYCSVPKTQLNTKAYNATAEWVINTGDPNLGKKDYLFYCHATAEQVGPLFPNGTAIFSYIGCFKENNPGRQLAVQLSGGQDKWTIEMCVNACSKASWTFSSMEYTNECWCGNALPVQKVPETNCNYPCLANNSQVCGGNGDNHDGSFMSLFADSTKYDVTKNITSNSGPQINPGVAPFSYLGCFTEPNGGRALPVAGPNSNNLTIASCLTACQGYQYAGAEYARECYCGNVLNPASVQKPDKTCGMTCTGNNTEFCGAGSLLSVYKVGGNYTPPSSTSSASASSTPSSVPSGAPTINRGVKPYSYLGCYREPNGARALTVPGPASDTLTIASCLAACNANGYQYAGAEYGRECFCGNTLNAGALVQTDASCDMTCAGNKTEYCGSSNLLSLYKANSTGTSSSSSVSSSVKPSATPSAGPVINPGVAPYVYAGCYTEPAGARALPVPGPASNTLTIATCLAACKANGYILAAAEYGRECYCGNALNPGSTKQADASCGMTCAGNSTEYCGSSNLLSLYRSTASVSSSVSSSSSTMSSSSVTMPSASASAGPRINPGVAPFGYIGCYNEPTGARALTVPGPAVDTLTIASCLTACKGYAYAGAEYGRECYCGNTLNAGSTKKADSSCSIVCAGNKTEYCGAGNFLSLYKTNSTGSSSSSASSASSSAKSSTLSSVSSSSSVAPSVKPTPTAVPSSGKYSFAGCWTEGTGVRALSASTQYNAKMTIAMCSNYCGAFNTNGTYYFGVEYATECWCGNFFGKGSLKTAVGECNMACGGDATALCGAGNRLQVYQYNTTLATASSAPSAAGRFAAPPATDSTTDSTTSASSSASSASSSASSTSASASSTSSSASSSALSSTSTSITSTSTSPSTTASPTPSSTASPSPTSSLSSASSTSTTPSSTSSQTVLATPVISKGDENFTYTGCFAEVEGRVLADKTYANETNMTVSNCLSFCYEYGFAGLEFHKQCFCGNELKNATRKLQDDECSDKCTGNASEYCGSMNKLTVYEKKKVTKRRLRLRRSNKLW